jgi:fimbrial isopeptide formation D2 family protein
VASAVFYKLGLFDDTMAAKPPTELLPSDGELLGGVEFKLYPVTSTSTNPYTLGALIDTKTTSSSNVGKGTVTFGNLKVGQLYALVETAAPPNYTTLETPVYFYIDAAGVLRAEDGTPYLLNNGIIKNQHRDADGTLSIIKQDAHDPSSKLVGAVFTLERYREGDGWVLIDTLTTNSAGFASANALKWGVYRLTEVVAPDGYVKLPQQKTFIIGRFDIEPLFAYTFDNTLLDPHLIKGQVVQTFEVSIPSQAQALIDAKAYFAGLTPARPTQEVLNPDGTVTLVIGLSGATFEMKEYEGASVAEGDLNGTWTLSSNADGTINLPAGFVFKENNTYTFRELTAPQGYVIDTRVITWRPGSEAGSIINNNGIKWLFFDNVPQTHRIVVSKSDGTRDGWLPDAEFVLLYPDGTYVFFEGNDDPTVFITDADGRIEMPELPAGTYYLKEITAPNGYMLLSGYWRIVFDGPGSVELNDVDHFDPDVIDDGSNVILGELRSSGDVFARVTNFRNPVDIEFDKIAADTGDGLFGAVFELRTLDGESLLGTATSDANGVVRFIGITPDTDGYRLVETIAPDDHLLPDGWWHVTIDVETGEILTMVRQGDAPAAIKNGDTQRWAVVNEVDVIGSLTVKKTVFGASEDESFDFKIWVLTDDVFEEYAWEEYTLFADDDDDVGTPVMFTGSNGEFTLKAGQRALFENLKPGMVFKVEELSSSGYRVRVEVTADGDTTVASNPAEVTIIGEDSIHFINSHWFHFPLTGGGSLSATLTIAAVACAIAGYLTLSAQKSRRTKNALFVALLVPLLLFTVGTIGADEIIIEAGQPGSITLHKYLLADLDDAGPANDGSEISSLPEGAVPLGGIVFHIRRVEPARADTPQSRIIAHMEGMDWIVSTAQALDAEVSTASDGTAIISGLARGYYLIVEKPSEAVADPVLPFIVAIPTTLPREGAADQELFDVVVYPKNMTVTLTKTLEYDDSSQGPHDSLRVGDQATWLIIAGVPSRIATADSYKIVDTFGVGLSYTAGSTSVHATRKLGGDLELTEGVDYTVDVMSQGPLGGGSVTLEFTAVGRARLAQCVEVVVRLKTVVLESAQIAVPLHNEVRVDYVNGDEWSLDPDYDAPPAVHTGGVRLHKVDDKTGNGLEGAVFKIVEKHTDNFEDDLRNVGFLQRDGQDYQASSDSNGNVEIKGLSYGGISDHLSGSTEYWLVEVAAPHGYVLPKEPAIAITIDANSYAQGYVKYTILNTASRIPPPIDKIIPDPKGPYATPKTGDALRLSLIVLALAGAVVGVATGRKNRWRGARPDQKGEHHRLSMITQRK